MGPTDMSAASGVTDSDCHHNKLDAWLGKYRHMYYHLPSPATLMTALSAMSSLKIDRGLTQGQAHTAGLHAAVSAAGNIGILQSLITCPSL